MFIKSPVDSQAFQAYHEFNTGVAGEEQLIFTTIAQICVEMNVNYMVSLAKIGII